MGQGGCHAEEYAHWRQQQEGRACSVIDGLQFIPQPQLQPGLYMLLAGYLLFRMAPTIAPATMSSTSTPANQLTARLIGIGM